MRRKRPCLHWSQLCCWAHSGLNSAVHWCSLLYYSADNWCQCNSLELSLISCQCWWRLNSGHYCCNWVNGVQLWLPALPSQELKSIDWKSWHLFEWTARGLLALCCGSHLLRKQDCQSCRIPLCCASRSLGRIGSHWEFSRLWWDCSSRLHHGRFDE